MGTPNSRLSTRLLLHAVPACCLTVVLMTMSSPGVADAADAPQQQWRSLFDGKTLGKWKVIKEFDFENHGKIHVKDGKLLVEKGRPAAGVKWTGKFPNTDYEVSLEAMRVDGHDFFCGMTFPVGKSSLTLVCGGWGGSVTGLSSIDGEPAVENETCGYQKFKQNTWYHVRLRVTRKKVEAWIDKDKIVDLEIGEHKFTIYWEVEPCLPFGIATWNTTAALRNIRVREIKP